MEFEELIIKGKICPYCRCNSKYVDSSLIYGKSYGMVYYCGGCDAYVGVHKGTNKSLGRLANKELRDAKKEAHFYFDSLWKHGIKKGRSKHEVRNSAYNWLSKKIGTPKKFTHIGMFNINLCRETVRICKPYKEKLPI